LGQMIRDLRSRVIFAATDRLNFMIAKEMT
jgi:hypothetical protein